MSSGGLRSPFSDSGILWLVLIRAQKVNSINWSFTPILRRSWQSQPRSPSLPAPAVTARSATHPTRNARDGPRLTGKTSGWLLCGGTCCSAPAGPWCWPCHCGHIPTASRAGNAPGAAASAPAGRENGRETTPGAGNARLAWRWHREQPRKRHGVRQQPSMGWKNKWGSWRGLGPLCQL